MEPANVPECLFEVLGMHMPSLEHLGMAMYRELGGVKDMAQIVRSGPWPHLTALYIGGYQLG